jgi:hypothetical protein
MFSPVNTMTQMNRFTLALETLAELPTGTRPDGAEPLVGLPNLSEVLAEFSPLPQQALFLGIASDGLPVLLNLRDPIPGAILIAGDPESGKTRMLQTMARGVDLLQKTQDVKYVVLTRRPEEWTPAESFTNCDGILLASSPEAADYLGSLAKWAQENRNDRQIVLLLMDDLEALVAAGESHQYLRWLLLNGPGRQVWPVVTLSADRANHLRSWMEVFRTRLHGHLENMADIEWLTGKSNFSFKHLVPGSQFAMREGNNWLPFWLPKI